MIAIVAAPTNLGLRPPEPTSTPGTSKAPEALREAGLHAALLADGALDAGVVLPGRYVDDATPLLGRIRNQDAVLDHARRLADRVGPLLDAGHSPLVLGGDCSILLGTGLALASRGRHGLVHLDGHTDFRHPGNSDECASLAGEDLAAAVGLHWPAISDIDGMGPPFSRTDVVHIGARDDDEELTEVRRLLGDVLTSTALRTQGVVVASRRARSVVDAAPDGYWLHLDIDILDAAVFPAVDSPDPGGLQADELVELLRQLAPTALGAQVTVFDPDLDPDGRYALLLSRIIRDGLGALGTARALR